jgi:hypothetical protein
MRTSTLQIILAVGLALNLVPAAAADTPEPVAVGADFQPADRAAKLFTVAQGQVLKGVKRVAVPLFTVDFVTADSEKASTSGFAAGGRATAISAYKLKGVAQPDFQALTDAAYSRFLDDLQTAGFETVPADKLQASATYRKLVASGKAAPALRDDGMMLAPPGMAIYGFSQAASGGAKPGLFGALAAMGSGFSAVGSAIDTVELGKELDAAVVEVQLRVHFVQLTNENKGLLGRLAGSASVSANVYPSIASATYSVQSSTRGTLTLKQPLALDAAAFPEVRAVPTTATDVAASVLTDLINLASRSASSTSTEDKEAIADPARYSASVALGLTSVNQMFVARLRAGE